MPNLTYHILAGTSLGVGQHIFQWYWHNKFRAFDYGRKRNQKEYGSSDPVDFSGHYGMIDIPVRLAVCLCPSHSHRQVHFVYGLNDKLIVPSDVAIHYRRLREAKPHLAFATSFSMGHVDFTYGLSDALISFVTRQLPKPQIRTRRSMSV